jgi:Tol biopolymer transport system component
MPSEPGTRAHAQSDLTDTEVRAQLGKILASEVFSRSPQLRRFLSFVVEQSLSAQGHTLKESVLAHELYGKGTDFDGGTDPVVRVDARRLRDKLREYYEDRSDPVVISLPKGSYVPVFSGNFQPEVPTVSPNDAARLSERWSSNVRQLLVYVGALALIVVALTIAIAWRALRHPADTAPQLLPLASYPGVEGPPALSPDGGLVAFAWSGGDRDGPPDIYIKDVGSEALRRLTETSSSETSPAWSPDGHSIAFVRAGEGIFTISQLGGTEQRLSASGNYVSWAGDSKSVLIRDREGTVGPFGIYQVFLGTLERRRLTQAPFGDGDWRFEVSPDGTTLAFIRYGRTGIADLYVAPMRGGEPRRLTDWNATLVGLSWMPDGREIVYSVEWPAVSRLWRIHANNSQPGRGVSIGDIPAAATNPSISRPRSGQPTRLAFQAITRDVDIKVMDLEAPLVNEIIASKTFANSTRIDGEALFSPDGGRIAFGSDRSGLPEIWVAARDGSGLQRITSLGAAQIGVTGWSPDGATIGLDAAIAGNTDVYVVGSDGGNLRRLTSDPAREGLPSWSGDGRWIYFVSTRAGVNPDVWRMTPDGGQPTRITHNGGFQPAESPDGQSLYYLDHYPGPNGTARLMRATVDGGQETVVLDGVRPFLWSVTEKGIAFVTRESDFDAIDMYRFSDRQVVRVGRLGFRIPRIFTHMTVSRDGRWALATQMVRYDSDLMLLDNFR